MTVEKALQLFKELEEDRFTQNLIAQVSSKNILLEANEPFENFPNYTENLDDKINYIAFSYLSIACALKEQQVHNEIANIAFEKSGDIIYQVHSPKNNKKENSNFYLLISSLSFYIASQYSKSFITIKKAESSSKFIDIVSTFLKKDIENLVLKINDIVLNNEFQEEQIVLLNDSMDANFKFYTVILAKVLNLVIEYIYSGNERWLNLAEEYILDLKELSSIDDEPLTWWVSRLISILLNTYRQYSFWNVLPTLIPSDKTTLYIQQLAFNNPSIIELFYTQYKAVNAMKNNNNIVISLPTSSGKTRIAEIAILETLVNNPESKVLYLAPFRSLSFEVEESMDKIFSPLGFSTTFLYGGAQYSKIDKTLIEHSNIIIATPEKAKAIIRADESIANKIKLLVIDEGHLLGANQRLIQNEMFTEELKFHMNKNNGKIILLSAVLPNTKDISKWISNDENNILESKKRLANQRFGILKWTKNKNIDIEWLGEPKSFNKSFIEKFRPPRARTRVFPQDKNEGYASTALKLSKLGTVLLFIAQARFVVTNAKKVLYAMGDNKQKVIWKNQNLFKTFHLACNEAGENEIFELAEYGILCHYGSLSTEVRNLLERIMRDEKPKVIVSTSTLGQGVNIGIYTVIFANVFMNHQNESRIDSKDFWNIAGRAGRAFVDIEGKILYAVDENHWSYSRDIKLCLDYFDISNMDKASSGLLSLIKEIKNIAIQCNINFDLLLQLISENDFSRLTTTTTNYSENILEAFNWIDDTLLALNYKKVAFFDADPSSWIDDYFRNSLAYIQAQNESDITQEEVIQFLKARNKAVVRIAGHSSNWESIVKSGIPLSSSVLIEEHIEEIKEIVQTYNQSEKNITDTIETIKRVESLIQQMPSTSFKHNFEETDVNSVREKWFSGVSLSEIKQINNGQKICVEYFGMTIPWAINAIVRKLYDMSLNDEAEVLENIALFSEMGLPNIFAIKIYLSGIKSRIASLDLSKIINTDLEDVSKGRLFNLIITNKEKISKYCLPVTSEWITIFETERNYSNNTEIPKVNNFTLKKIAETIESDVLNIRKNEQNLYLCSPDFKTKIAVLSTDSLPFSNVGNNMGVCFMYDDFNKNWFMKVRNPNLIIENS
ncbi:DEAD/DEAH box helicase [Aliarcobacter butzleri]|uniref:DEAD/DEAH box helicase n=1 Tax=Aliarcobacter butzleri TaxID=28197 RepID=UPI00263C33BF|nr:DEAD/DEAH box helicase [Aliarcobacter butzleri]MDN5049656.1 DEAD/DEAH box helicase [Aliarcobacter butzleri]MDN5056541.1 DEAD/DEAH box helicase [Aliarcobacter butzleri]